MTKKPRTPSSKRGESSGKTSPPSAKAGAAKSRAGKPKGTSQEGSPPAADKAASASGSSLPAFGFAKDVLAKVSEPGDESAPPTEPAAGQDVDEKLADRIFKFADSLTTGGGEDEEDAPKRLETWVTFDLADEIFAIPVSMVREALRVSTITRVPHAPHPIRGVTNLRGKVIPVIDLRVRIELPAREIDRLSRILVVGSRGRVLGLLVDAVRQVAHIEVDRIQPPPEDVVTVQSDYLLGVYHHGDLLVLLLDVDRILIIKEAGAA